MIPEPQNGSLGKHALSYRGRHVWCWLLLAEGYEQLHYYFRWRPCVVMGLSEMKWMHCTEVEWCSAVRQNTPYHHQWLYCRSRMSVWGKM